MKEHEVKYVNLTRLRILVGSCSTCRKHINRRLTRGALSEGVFSLTVRRSRGWKAINESDMTLMPEASRRRFWIRSRRRGRCWSLICDIAEAATRQPYTRDPLFDSEGGRGVPQARRGIADTVYFGPEAEFFVFDDIRFERGPHTPGVILQGRHRGRAPLTVAAKEERGRQSRPPARRAKARLFPRAADGQPGKRFPRPKWCRCPSRSLASRSRSTTTRWRTGGQGELGIMFCDRS